MELVKGKIVAPAIHVYDNAIENPQHYIDVALAQADWRDAEVLHHADKEDLEIDQSFRNNRILGLPVQYKDPIEWYMLSKTIWSYANQYSKEYNIGFGNMEPLGMLHYEKGTGFYKPHVDHNDMLPRTFSALLYLNDVEEGGETHFVHFDLSVKPKAGRLVLFPADYAYLHGAKTPLSGDKFAVVTWFNPVKMF